MSASLYDRITELHGIQPWGSVLDAGTGSASMRWLLSLQSDRWTAVTGSPRMAEKTSEVIGTQMRSEDRLVVGNWMDPELLAGERYDTVLADYLLGAVEGFAPYWQDRLFCRLRPLVRKRLYVIGLEPYVPYVPADPSGKIVNDIGRLRDACLLLSGDRPYREFPMDWVLRQLELASFKAVDVHRIGIRYGEMFINSQLDLAAASLGRLQDRALAVSLQQHIAGLRARALAMAGAEGGLRHGHDYLIVASPV